MVGPDRPRAGCRRHPDRPGRPAVRSATRLPSCWERRISIPSSHPLLGTDFLARDVFSRVLWGGRTVIALAGAATLLAYLVGVPIGLLAGVSRSFVDPLLMRIMDVFLAFPAHHPAARSRHRRRPQPVGARRRRGDHACAGHIANRPDGDARGVRARLCRSGRRSGRAAHVHPQARDPAEHRHAHPRGCGHPPHRVDPAGGVRELPRARASAAGGGLGIDDLGKPRRLDDSGLALRRAHRC